MLCAPAVRRHLGALLFGAAIVLQAGCVAEPTMVHTVDLAAQLPAAELAFESQTIDLGEPAARRSLGDGWSSDERRSSGLDFVWAVGRHATVELFAASSVDLPLRVRCRPFSYPGGPRQTVSFRLGGTTVGGLALEEGWREYELVLPAAAVAPGSNRLELDAAYATAPAEVLPSDDPRPLAVAWDWIRVGTGEAGVPAADAERIRLPARSETAWYLPAGAGARLTGTIGVATAGDSRLEVWWRTDAGEPRRVATAGVGDRLAVDLPEAAGPARLALRVTGAGLELGRPRLERTTAPPPAVPTRPASPRAPAGRPNVLLYSVDTLRPDRLGCYGGPSALSPRLDGLAATGVVFEQARATTSWTKPSLATVLTGLDSLSHGLVVRERRVPAAATTLAESLAAAGYATGAFVTNGYLVSGEGFEQGFGWYRYDPVDAATATARALQWLDGRSGARPFLLWVHTIDPHAPYQPSQPWRRRFAPEVPQEVGTVADIRALGGRSDVAQQRTAARYRRLYDAEIAQNDAAFGELLDGLAERGHRDDTVVVFLSDHGEAFLERGVVGHGWDLHEETVRVPLVIRPAGGGAGRRVAVPVGLADVLPTMLAAAGVAAPSDLDGRDLWPAVTGSGPPPSDRLEVLFLDEQRQRSVATRDGRWKMLAPLEVWGTGRPTLYDLAADPGELVDLATERPVTAGWLAFEARCALARGPRWPAETGAALDPATRRDLEALGYLVER